MPLLLKRREEVKNHWHAAAHELGGILPGEKRLYRSRWDEPAGTAATMICQAFPGEWAERDNGLRVPIVPLIQSLPDESPVYWVSWFEQWSPEEKANSRNLQFRSSSITFYRGAQDSPKLQLLRAEWTGVQKIEKSTDIFQGSGAAHPHWHFDALHGYLDDVARQIDAVGGLSDAIQGEAVEEFREFGDEQAEREVAAIFLPRTVQLPSQSELSWSAIHLAAAARWSEEAWPGPDGPHDVHARGPESLEALRRWIYSCVRYVQAEINKAEA